MSTFDDDAKKALTWLKVKVASLSGLAGLGIGFAIGFFFKAIF